MENAPATEGSVFHAIQRMSTPHSHYVIRQTETRNVGLTPLNENRPGSAQPVTSTIAIYPVSHRNLRIFFRIFVKWVKALVPHPHSGLRYGQLHSFSKKIPSRHLRIGRGTIAHNIYAKECHSARTAGPRLSVLRTARCRQDHLRTHIRKIHKLPRSER